MAEPLAKIEYVVLCDEIRKEDNGKLMLVGVYSGDILLKSFPAKVGLSAYLIGRVYRDGEAKIDLRYVFESTEKPKKIVLSGKVSIESSARTTEFSSPTIRVPMEFSEPGTLIIDYRLDGGRWRKIARKNIATPTGSATIAPERPS